MCMQRTRWARQEGLVSITSLVPKEIVKIDEGVYFSARPGREPYVYIKI